MTWRFVSLAIAGVIIACVAAGALWLFSLQDDVSSTNPAPIPQEEKEANLAALKPPKRDRPVIAVIGINDATETTDYLTAYGILRRADIADVALLSTAAGPVKLYPALTVVPEATIAEFDAINPDGADYVIVPAMSRDDDPTALDWIRDQASKGAVVIGVCAGAKVVAAAGLLDGRKATTHWYYLDEMLKEHPSIRYVADRRIVIDNKVVTTTGISASIPLTLTLIEAIAGREKSIAVANQIGISDWDARHDSSAFQFTRQFATTVIGNVLSFWNRDTIGIRLSREIDVVSLALVADAWSRTYRSRATTVASAPHPVITLNGVGVLPDRVVTNSSEQKLMTTLAGKPPVQALDDAIATIEGQYGSDTAALVTMQLEYPHMKEP